MPNHIANMWLISGPEHDLQKIKTVMTDVDGNVTYGKLLPMPDSPVLQAVHIGYANLDDGKMNEWIEDYDRTGHKFNRKLTEAEEEELDRVGYRSVIDFARKVWGVKWDAYKVYRPENTVKLLSNKLVLQFDSPWMPPIDVYNELMSRFPECSFTARYYDEGDGEWHRV